MSALELVDRATHDVSRTMSTRHSRRGFLARTAKVAAAVTGVSIVEGSLTAPAYAHHFCGHTGTSPTCSGNVCTQLQGGCWYACCPECGIRLKRICDCCVSGTTSGYCPSGYHVNCVTWRCSTGTCG